MIREHSGAPAKHGLYDPANEKDGCGVGFVAHIKGQRSHQILVDAAEVLSNMDHRGGCGCEPNTGDGAGMLTALPHEFLAKVVRDRSSQRPARPWPVRRRHRVPTQDRRRARAVQARGRADWWSNRASGWSAGGTCRLTRCGGPWPRRSLFRAGTSSSWSSPPAPIGPAWRSRTTPSNGSSTSSASRPATCCAATSAEPSRRCSTSAPSRRRSSSTRACSRPSSCFRYFPDLADPDYTSHLAMVHSRFSTNTFPSWDRAQPCRFMSHNGEINTLRGNINWMQAREGRGAERPVRRRTEEAVPGRRARLQRLRHVRQRAGVPADDRPHAAGIGDDDDPRGVAESRDDVRRQAGVLRIPLAA